MKSISLFAFLLFLCLSSTFSCLFVSSYTLTATSNTQGSVVGLTGLALTPTNARATGSVSSEVTITVEPVATASISVGSVTTASLPAGSISSTFTGLVAVEVGYSVSVQATTGTSAAFTMDVTTPGISNYNEATTSGKVLTVFRYDAATSSYVKVPANQIVINNDRSVKLTINVAGTYYFTFQGDSIVNLAANYVVAANSSMNFIINEGEAQGTILVRNLNCAAGSISFAISSSSAALEQKVNATGRVLLSKVYTFTHSAGNQANIVADFVFDGAKSATATAVSATVNAGSSKWYVYNTASTQWDVAGGSVSGSVVTYSTTHFSDWSVQAEAAASSAFNMATVSFALIHVLVMGLVGVFTMA